MTKRKTRAAAILGAVLLLAGCSKPAENAADPAAIARAAEAAAVAPSVDPDQAAALKALIEQGGKKCDQIASVQGQELTSDITVTCTGAGLGNVKYTIDLASEQARKSG